jgi:hypothetical protein
MDPGASGTVALRERLEKRGWRIRWLEVINVVHHE